jgi:hypothetical protein
MAAETYCHVGRGKYRQMRTFVTGAPGILQGAKP